MRMREHLKTAVLTSICTSVATVAVAMMVSAGNAPEPAPRSSFGSLENLSMLSDAQSRSISPENFTGEKGKAGMATEGTGKRASAALGQGWKVSPSVNIKSHETFTLADIKTPGEIEHIWMTPTGNWRHSIIRFYWDGETEPSVEAPVGDFFACGNGKYSQINSLAVCVNPGSAFNCYWRMPFRKSARITLENQDEKGMVLYYQVDYAQSDVSPNAGYFHAQFRHENPLKEKGIYTILDNVKGKGQYVGTYLTWHTNAPRWWGEGEIKFYMDGDDKFPTICGTGTEDYFCGSYDFTIDKKYRPFSTPYTGLTDAIPADKLDQPDQRFGLYRWHITDPIRFDKDLKVTIQALGWQGNGQYLQEDCEISSVAFWYQSEPHEKFPELAPR